MVRPVSMPPRRPPSTIMTATASGQMWRLLDPSSMDVDFRAIAAHLAKLCRFGGACYSFYSVAQHSVVVAEQLPPSLRLYGLLHDAHEALIGDITAPMKEAMAIMGAGHVLHSLADFQDIAIHAAAGLNWPPSPDVVQAVHEADMRALATEWRDLMPADAPPPKLPCRPMGTRIRPWPWPLAEERFLDALMTHLPSHLRSPA